jgi:hypothetical protein
MNYLKIKEQKDGNLKIAITPEGKKFLSDALKSKSGTYDEIWLDLLTDQREPDGGNYEMIRPEILHALTDAPIIGWNIFLDDDGEIDHLVDSKIWWFPEYQVADEFGELLKKGFVLFTRI